MKLRNLFEMDDKLRQLERRAAQGDPSAEMELTRHQERAVDPVVWVWRHPPLDRLSGITFLRFLSVGLPLVPDEQLNSFLVDMLELLTKLVLERTMPDPEIVRLFGTWLQSIKDGTRHGVEGPLWGMLRDRLNPTNGGVWCTVLYDLFNQVESIHYGDSWALDNLRNGRFWDRVSGFNVDGVPGLWPLVLRYYPEPTDRDRLERWLVNNGILDGSR